MSKRHLTRIGLLGALVCVLGFGLLVHMWIKLGRDGIAADENGTSGYISNGDLGLVGLGIALLVLGGAALIASVRGWRRRGHS